MVNTKSAPRRALKFSSLDELSAELDRLDTAHAAGKLGHTGNWTPGQILDHLGNFWTCSLDGFGPTACPAVLRVFASLLFKKQAIAGKPPPPGIKMPKNAPQFAPRPGVTYAQGAENLRTCIHRVQRGDPYVPASPLFGKLTEGEWTRLNLGHCSMHLSFISIQE